MEFPELQRINAYREITTKFGGYDHRLSCGENQFYEMENMTSDYFPILSPRHKRGLVRNLKNPQGILDKEELMWIDDGKLYKNGAEVSLPGVTISSGLKTMAKMGAFVTIFPDKIWYNADNGECGYMESKFTLPAGGKISFSMADIRGKVITYHDDAYYKDHPPKTGDFLITTENGKDILKVYSEILKLWSPVPTTYVNVCATGIGSKFNKEDGLKLILDNSKAKWGDADNIFVNTEKDGRLSTNGRVIEKTNDCITIVGIISKNVEFTNMPFYAGREVPDMEFITESNNRLWGCSKDGHEVYCCKLGDVKNWNVFSGVSTDSWRATIGSDGKFTGAATFLGYPTFFKEDSMLKIAISNTGAHQTRETSCIGVQAGSEKSMAIMNNTLFYLSPTGVCAFTGSLPTVISDSFGEVRYRKGVGGIIGHRYYLSVEDSSGKTSILVWDDKNGIWCKEDSVRAIYSCTHDNDLYFIDDKNHMYSVRGTLLYDVPEKELEGRFPWSVVSGTIGYQTADNKYCSRINVRISLDFGSDVDFFLSYDGGAWEHKFHMAGKGTRSYAVPIIPKRCDHFRYRIVGNGGCKIYSITKTIEGGSDV